MSDAPILSESEVASYEPVWGLTGLLRSHEALRARVAAAEAERDFYRTDCTSILRAEAAEARVAALTAALDVEHNYWTTRSHLARTKTETVMAEWHLDLIDGALAAVPVPPEEPA